MTEEQAPVQDNKMADNVLEPPPDDGLPVSRTGLSGFFKGLIGGLVGTTIAIAVMIAVAVSQWPVLQSLLLSEQERRIDVLERAINDLNPRLSMAEHALAQNAGAADAVGMAQTLNQRVQALEAQNRAPLADSHSVSMADRMDRLAGDVAHLTGETQSLRNAIPPEGTILRLAERAEAAERQTRAIASQHASAQALLLVVGQLHQAVETGDPFGAELLAARKLAHSDEEIAALDQLAPLAANGVPRKNTLTAQFGPLAADILHADLLAPEGGFWQRLLYKATALITLRRTDGSGNDTAAIVARAEEDLRNGDLAKAVDELSRLSTAPLHAANAWIDRATARVSADRALSALAANAAAQTAQEN